MKQIFLYVGHSNFGKSFALKDLTNGDSRKKSTHIDGKKLKVRKMSNDDDEKRLLEFVKKIKNTNYDYYIIAFCPRQEESKNAKEILEILKDIGNLYFFVQKNSFSDDREILDNEITGLKKYGIVEILCGKLEYKVRSEKFKEFIQANMK